MIDTHCHLTDTRLLSRLDEVMSDAVEAGVRGFVVPSVNVADSRMAVSLARDNPRIVAAAGIHPMWADFEDDHEMTLAIDSLAELIENDRQVIRAIGEIGLDPHTDSNDGKTGRIVSREMAEMRRTVFIRQVELARSMNLPVIIHWRGSYGRGKGENWTVAELVEILEHFGPAPAGGVLHAFSGSAEISTRLAALGYRRGVAGTITRPGTPRLRQAIAGTPIENIVIETDAPFIANRVHARGDVVATDLTLVAKELAIIKAMDESKVADITERNAAELFNITLRTDDGR